MTSASTVDVARIIDERKLDGFSWSVIVWSFIIIIFDGYGRWYLARRHNRGDARMAKRVKSSSL